MTLTPQSHPKTLGNHLRLHNPQLFSLSLTLDKLSAKQAFEKYRSLGPRTMLGSESTQEQNELEEPMKAVTLEFSATAFLAQSLQQERQG